MKKSLLKLPFLLLCIFSIEACSDNNIDAFESKESYSYQYNTFTKSAEFVNYKSNLKKVNDKVNEFINSTSTEDIDQIAQLYLLYKTNPVKYKVLLEEKIKTTFKCNYNNLNNDVSNLYKNGSDLIKTNNYKRLNDYDKKILTTQLITNDNRYLSMEMTRSSSNNCVSDCVRIRENSIYDANYAFSCALVTGLISSCFFGFIPSAIAVLGAAAARDHLIRRAHEEYNHCISRCK